MSLLFSDPQTRILLVAKDEEDEEEHSDLLEDENAADERRESDAGVHFTHPCAQNLAGRVPKANDSIATAIQSMPRWLITTEKRSPI